MQTEFLEKEYSEIFKKLEEARANVLRLEGALMSIQKMHNDLLQEKQSQEEEKPKAKDAKK